MASASECIAGAAGTASTAISAVVWPVLILALTYIIANLIAKWWQDHNIADYVRSTFQLMVAYIYIKANRDYQQCTGTWAKYPDQEGNYKDITLVSKSSLSQLQDKFANVKNEDACNTGWTDVLHPVKLIGAAFCALGLMLQSWANSLMCFAQNQLTNAIGLNSIPLSGTECATGQGVPSYLRESNLLENVLPN
jgi:hypothetical protein